MTRNSTFATSLKNKSMCSQLTRSLGEDPIGSVPEWERCLVMELPAPWQPDVTQSRHFPSVLRNVISDTAIHTTHTRIQCVLPDPEYSVPGHTRLMLFSRPLVPFSTLDRLDYLVPNPEAENLAVSLLTSRNSLKTYIENGVEKQQRELLVCTHGTRDTCCATFGYPLYKRLRARADNKRIRIWRTSHTGGHRFAPTLVDLPSGHYWANLDDQSLNALINRKGNVDSLRSNYRGWAGVSSAPVQSVEREVFMAEGWDWLNYHKSAKLIETKPEETQFSVYIFHSLPNGLEQGKYEAIVKQVGSIPLPKCLSDGTKGDTPQYQVSKLKRTSFPG